MDKIEKFLRLLSPQVQSRVVRALLFIANGKLDGLDIKPLQGKKNWFRCRIGDIRIIFIRLESGVNIIHDVQFHGKAYKKL